MGEVVDFQKYKIQKLLNSLEQISISMDITDSVDFRGYEEVSISFKDLVGEAQIEYFAHCLQCSEDMNDFHLEGLEPGFCSKECQQTYYTEFNKWLLERN